MEADVKEERKISDRERDEELRKKTGSDKVDIVALRKKATQPQNLPITTHNPRKEYNDDSESESLSEEDAIPSNKLEEGIKVRNYVCEKCKDCDEYLKTSEKDLSCRNCKCDMIFHLYDADEELDDEEAEEWVDDDEDSS